MATISVQTTKFADLEVILSVTGTEKMLIHDGNGVKVITVENLHKGLQTDIDSVRNVLADGAAAHNCIYRGKNLGTSVTAEQYAAISSGKFTDLYIGDYWVIKGVTYRIAAFDYYYNCGDTNFTKHHVVIVPDTSLYKAQMNTSNVTTGGYTGSAMYKSNLAQAKTTIKAAFGSAHVLTKRELLTNVVYPAESKPTFSPYRVKVTASVLNIRKGAGTNYALAGTIRGGGVYTIVQESTGQGATKWGKLKSGAGWISLDYTTKVS